MKHQEDFPWVYPPKGFIPWNRTSSIQVAAGAAYTVVESVSIPMGMAGWMTQCGLVLSDFTQGATLRLAQAGVPVRDYALIGANMGAPETPIKMYMRLLPSQDLTLMVANPGGAPITARWLMNGWYYPHAGGSL